MAEKRAPTATSERRQAPRHRVDVATHVSVDDRRIACRLVDISAGGARIHAAARLDPGRQIQVELPGIGAVPATVVRAAPDHIALAFPGVVLIGPVLRTRADA